MSDTVFDDLTLIFRKELGDDSLVLEDKTTAKDVEGWDSVTHVMIIVAVERKFRIRLTAGEIQNLNCVGDLVKAIRSKLK